LLKNPKLARLKPVVIMLTSIKMNRLIISKYE
jgi:hypothetical protein